MQRSDFCFDLAGLRKLRVQAVFAGLCEFKCGKCGFKTATLPSSGPAFGRPLKSNVRRHMLTFNVYDRVFFVRGDLYGTAFTLDVDGRQYLISAKHVLGESSPPTQIKLYLDKRWIELDVTHVGTARGEVDLIVLAPAKRLSEDIELETSLEMVLGQDVYFAGFPLKMHSNGGELMYGRPLPFVKKGTLSAGWDPDDSIKRLYVDAISNLGFSGGPLVFREHSSGKLKVAAVVSKFKTEDEPVIDAEGNDTGLKVQYNTGFLIAYGINHALEIIRRNPVGLQVLPAA